jgi:ubiquinone biosynthesis protein
VETLERSVELEMDLRLEASAMSEMAENTRNDPGFRVPDRCSGRKPRAGC